MSTLHKEKEIFTCDSCDSVFDDKKKFEDHLKNHTQEPRQPDQTISTLIQCSKCEKMYDSMEQLRRHDWRNHRSIKCTMCDDILNSRQEIASHRQYKHGMFKKQLCKFYPNCLDGDECIYEHVTLEQDSSTCVASENCRDQACTKKHRKSLKILCKFQANCNRLSCPYQHTVQRTAFLAKEESAIPAQ